MGDPIVKKSMILLIAVLLLAGGIVVSASEPDAMVSSDPMAAPPSCPGDSWKIVRLICAGGSRGGVAGNYGGAGFSLFCDSGHSTQAICTYGQSYAMRLGQDRPVGVDCFFNGERPAVAEKCGDLHIVIVGKPSKFELTSVESSY